MIDAAKIAQAYDTLREIGPGAIPAWAELAKQIDAQFRNLPLKPTPSETDPYKGSAQLFAAINRGEFKVFTGGGPHPLWTAEQNWRFRAVHDWIGHYCPRNSFSLSGEIKAWQNHCRSLRGTALAAVTTETLGQACFYLARRAYAPQRCDILPRALWEGEL